MFLFYGSGRGESPYGLSNPTRSLPPSPANAGRKECPLPPVTVSITALAVATIYYAWRDGYYWRLLKDKSLRERVAYMLWTAAQQSAPV